MKEKNNKEVFGDSTTSVHAGSVPDPTTGALVTPISLSTTFQQLSPGVHGGFCYSRSDNPTRRAWEAQVAASERAVGAVAFASGCAATAAVLQLFSAGDRIVSMKDLYGGTFRFFDRLASAPRGALVFDFADFALFASEEHLAAFCTGARALWVESPTNPCLKIADLALCARAAHQSGCFLVVDNTFATPLAQRPLAMGADVVLHSATKYLNGHSDVVGGVVCAKDEQMVADLRFIQAAAGAVPGPMDCWLAQRGMKTLALRMCAQCAGAQRVAEFLEGHTKVEKVLYPGLASHPQHELAKRQMKMYGGIVAFYVRGGLEETKRFLEATKLVALAESLGAVESLVNLPVVMTHAAVPKKERVEMGVTESLVRLSVGIEDVEDIIADLDQALSCINQIE